MVKTTNKMWSEQLGIFHSPNFSGGLCRTSTLAFAGRAEALEEPLGFQRMSNGN
jgi:hypothetical protein